MKHGSESSLPSDTCNLRLQPNTAVCKVQAGEPYRCVTNRKHDHKINLNFVCLCMYTCTCVDAEARGQLQLSFPRHYQPCLLRYSLSWAWGSLRNHKLAAQKALGITCLEHVITPCLLCGFWELNQVLLLTRQLLSQVSFLPSFLPQNALRKHLIIHRAPWLRTTAG